MALARRDPSGPLVAAVVGALAGCGDGGTTPRDAGPDSAGNCGAATYFTGELIDWDSTETRFCGVFDARLTVRGQAAPGDTSNPNGRFELCVPHQALTEIDVAYAASPSQCTTPGDAYPVRAVLAAEQAVIDAGGRFSARAMTQHRQDDLFTQIGTTFLPARAQLVVHVDGPARQILLSTTAHDTTQKFDGAAWAAGDTGSDVYFPNVEPGTVQVSVAGHSVGATTLTLEAGAYTYLAVLAN